LRVEKPQEHWTRFSRPLAMRIIGDRPNFNFAGSNLRMNRLDNQRAKACSSPVACCHDKDETELIWEQLKFFNFSATFVLF
jgi:hypothetical protein